MNEYLDTSIVVKWFKKKEPLYKESLMLRKRIINFETEFVMSEYGLLELVRALVKDTFPKHIVEYSFQNVQDLYEVNALKKVPLENVVFLTKDIVIDLNLYASDALHLASAINYGCKVFWSADQHHLKEKTKKYMQRYNIEVRSLKEV